MKDNKIIIAIICGILVLACIGFLISGRANRKFNNYINFNNFEKSITKEIEDTKKEIEKEFKKAEKEIKKSTLNTKDMKSTNVNITIKNVESDDENISNIKVNILYNMSTESDKESNSEFEIKVDKAKAEVTNKEEILNSISNEDVKEIASEIIEKCIKEKLYNATNLNMQYSYNKQTNK